MGRSAPVALDGRKSIHKTRVPKATIRKAQELSEVAVWT